MSDVMSLLKVRLFAVLPVLASYRLLYKFSILARYLRSLLHKVLSLTADITGLSSTIVWLIIKQTSTLADLVLSDGSTRCRSINIFQ